MKNAYGVPPTRYMKREESKYAICCDPNSGPMFGDYDICIGNGIRYNEVNSGYINNDGTHGYECDSKHRCSLFVNTARANQKNMFSVLDYEVYCIDYENRDNLNKLCKQPDIIYEYIKTKDISVESLKQVDDDGELLNDLDTIHCEDDYIRMKVSKYCFKNASKLLVGTQIVGQQYDDKLREWCGDFKWKLIYRASEHGYTSYSFHEYCDHKRPTLTVIKSRGGWIFGGYTTESWEYNSYGCIYNDMI